MPGNERSGLMWSTSTAVHGAMGAVQPPNDGTSGTEYITVDLSKNASEYASLAPWLDLCPKEAIVAAEKSMDKEVFETMPVPQAVKSFVIPSLLARVITIIYSTADTFFIGMLGDPAQVAALTIAFPFYNMLNAFASLWGVGANSVMSVELGKKGYDRASKISLYGFWGSIIFMIVVFVGYLLFQDQLLTFGGAGPETLEYARSYMLMGFVIGGIPTVLSVVMANLLRAEGHAKTASNGLLLGGILNFFLDPLFIFPLHMGVVGAALADAIANCISLAFFLVVYYRMRKTSYITIVPFAHKIKLHDIVDLVLCGLPSCALAVLGAIGCMVQNSLYALYGTAVVAGWGVVLRFNFFGINATHGTAQGVLPLVGYNYGAKNYERMRACILQAGKWLAVMTIVLLVACEVVPAQLIRLFINDAASISAGTPIMRIYMLCMPFMAVILFVSTICQAVGLWQWSLGLLGIRQLLFNIPITIVLERIFGLYGIPAGQPTCDIICFFMALYVYRQCFVKMVKKE